jgi:hypothetical protein
MMPTTVEKETLPSVRRSLSNFKEAVSLFEQIRTFRALAGRKMIVLAS